MGEPRLLNIALGCGTRFVDGFLLVRVAGAASPSVSEAVHACVAMRGESVALRCATLIC